MNQLIYPIHSSTFHLTHSLIDPLIHPIQLLIYPLIYDIHSLIH